MDELKIKGNKITAEEREKFDQLGVKWCSGCRKALEKEKFSLKNHYCKECVTKDYLKNKERVIAYSKEWRLKNPEKIKIRRKNYGPRRRELYNNMDIEARRKAGNEKSKRTYDKNPKKVLDRNRAWKKNNPDKVKAFPSYKRKLEKAKIKRKTDKSFAVFTSLRNSISRIRGGKATRSTLEIVGVASIDEFIQKMNEVCQNTDWSLNPYHIDHIWQVNWFNLESSDPVFLCQLINHYSNLRPLPQKDNLIRSIYDFSPLKKEDFPKYEPYLKPEIREKIKDYFNNV